MIRVEKFNGSSCLILIQGANLTRRDELGSKGSDRGKWSIEIVTLDGWSELFARANEDVARKYIEVLQ